jgi:opacity protein-like surface antigen
MAKAAILFAGVLLAASWRWAHAVDLPPVPSLPQFGPEAEESSGWYLRGDIGLGVAGKPDLENAPSLIPLTVRDGLFSPHASEAFGKTTLSPFGVIDAGVGYWFNDWLRLDATLEYRGGAKLHSLHTLTDFENPAFGGPLLVADSYRANAASVTGLINGYVNLPAFWGVSPFIGTGIGFADNNLSSITGQGYARVRSGLLTSSRGSFSTGSRTGFAWALTAGVDFSITQNLKLEASYRYLNFGKVTSGGSHCLAPVDGVFNAADCIGVANDVRSNNTLASKDFRLGLIWLIGEPAPPSPTPVVARY